MKINVIIGAGQLGSRHLQGLLRLSILQTIYVIDPSVSSLEVAKQRAKEIENESKIHFVNEWQSIPKELDLVIVATGANVRKMVVSHLLDNYLVKYLVLEKVLFQDLESYNEINQKLLGTSTKTWVNHPRRMLEPYKLISRLVKESGETVRFNVIGYNWGLGCNGLHLIDLCAFISNSKVLSIDSKWLDNTLQESKRPGYKEFTGTITGRMRNKSSFSISSINKSSVGLSIIVSSQSNNWVVEEGSSISVLHQDLKSTNNDVLTSYANEYQSTLTTAIADAIFTNGTCDLPSYADACISHLPFISALLEKYQSISGDLTDICPIT